jgi:hypothetical protein
MPKHVKGAHATRKSYGPKKAKKVVKPTTKPKK